MSDDGAGWFDRCVAGWLAGRRYGVPAAMVAEAGRYRLAGDWRAACAAARFDVRFDLAAVRREHGAQVAERAGDDLTHLVPDLVRWHLPRLARGGSGVLEPGLTVPLAVYGLPGGPYALAPEETRVLAVAVRTPAHVERPQRVELRLEPITLARFQANRWDGARYLWDARHTVGLLARLGGGDRVPFFERDGAPRPGPAADPGPGDPVTLAEWITSCQDAGEYEQAWTAAGLRADFTEPASSDLGPWRPSGPPERNGMATAVLATLRARQATGSWAGDRATTVRLTAAGSRRLWVKVTVEAAGGDVVLVDRYDEPDLVPAPEPWWRRFTELDLLRHNRLTPTGLHPLVRAAMFPEGRDHDDYHPLDTVVPPAAVAVRCGRTWHRVEWAGGRIEASAHDSAELRRERTLRSLGRPGGRLRHSARRLDRCHHRPAAPGAAGPAPAYAGRGRPRRPG